MSNLCITIVFDRTLGTRELLDFSAVYVSFQNKIGAGLDSVTVL